jgi:hypothetical protein
MSLTLHKVLQVGCCGAIAYLMLSGCAAKPAYKDVPYTPSGKVNFDSLDSGATKTVPSSPSSVTVAKQQPISQPNPSDATTLGTATHIPDTITPEVRTSGPDVPLQPDEIRKPESKCTGDQSSILTLKTESYDVTVCDDRGSLRYHGTYRPSGSETELPALLSDSGYYVKNSGYEYWVTPRSIAIYQGKKLLLEEFAQ